MGSAVRERQRERGRPSHRKRALHSTWPFKVKSSPKTPLTRESSKDIVTLKGTGRAGKRLGWKPGGVDRLYGTLKQYSHLS